MARVEIEEIQAGAKRPSTKAELREDLLLLLKARLKKEAEDRGIDADLFDQKFTNGELCHMSHDIADILAIRAVEVMERIKTRG